MANAKARASFTASTGVLAAPPLPAPRGVARRPQPPLPLVIGHLPLAIDHSPLALVCWPFIRCLRLGHIAPRRS
jgi:hypothetical protein